LSHSLAYLPAWVIVALVWHFRIFTGTHVLLVLAVHLLFGFSLASYSFFVAAPFGSSPQLAAVTSTFLSIVLAILALIIRRPGNGVAFIFSIVFPPGFYIFAIKAICGWENEQIATNALKRDPDDGLTLLPLMIAALIDIFLWPWLAVILERRLYDPKPPSTRRMWIRRLFAKDQDDTRVATNMSPDLAISVRNLEKTYTPGWFGRKRPVTAVENLSFDVLKNGIFVLLGSNGSVFFSCITIIADNSVVALASRPPCLFYPTCLVKRPVLSLSRVVIPAHLAERLVSSRRKTFSFQNSAACRTSGCGKQLSRILWICKGRRKTLNSSLRTVI
jgi:ATP-binding cassette, subfamily A (ABC1), member 3